MRDLLILLVHLIATLARLMGPGGLRSVVAESLLVKQQLLILNRSRHRAPNLRASDRIVAGVCALFMRPARVLRSAVVLRPSTILDFHRMLRRRGTDAPICQDSRSRSQVCGLARSVVCHHALKNLAGENAFETADDLPFGPPFSGASFDVVEGW